MSSTEQLTKALVLALLAPDQARRPRRPRRGSRPLILPRINRRLKIPDQQIQPRYLFGGAGFSGAREN